jgi:Mn2+/Fe2+ NRAMP family transporter
MEKKHVSAPVSPGAAREELRAARRAREGSVRRAANPAGLILSLSFFCGALTLAPAHQKVGGAVMIIAVVWFVAELLMLSARNQWRALRSMPRPRWNLTEMMLICAALVLGGLIGPHLLAGRANSSLASWGLAGGVAVTVSGLLLAANTSYRRRSS